jgi:CheY-like chemotaxis protein
MQAGGQTSARYEQGWVVPLTDGPACILVVDDDASVRGLYAALLHGAGYRVETAVDGQDGLNQLACNPDLILLDLMMPFMDGRQFLGRLRALPTHRQTPVIVITAARGEGPIDGAQAVMAKPFQIDELLNRVARLLPPAGDADA